VGPCRGRRARSRREDAGLDGRAFDAGAAWEAVCAVPVGASARRAVSRRIEGRRASALGRGCARGSIPDLRTNYAELGKGSGHRPDIDTYEESTVFGTPQRSNPHNAGLGINAIRAEAAALTGAADSSRRWASGALSSPAPGNPPARRRDEAANRLVRWVHASARAGACERSPAPLPMLLLPHARSSVRLRRLPSLLLGRGRAGRPRCRRYPRRPQWVVEPHGRRANYRSFGSCDEKARQHVRKPLAEEIPE
jgi:hypothetical protein